MVGIDAEFVALTAEETELRLDGTNVVTKTSRMSLGRVSVVRDLDRLRHHLLTSPPADVTSC
jgi:hypothetical protein